MGGAMQRRRLEPVPAERRGTVLEMAVNAALRLPEVVEVKARVNVPVTGNVATWEQEQPQNHVPYLILGAKQ